MHETTEYQDLFFGLNACVQINFSRDFVKRLLDFYFFSPTNTVSGSIEDPDTVGSVLDYRITIRKKRILTQDPA